MGTEDSSVMQPGESRGLTPQERRLAAQERIEQRRKAREQARAEHPREYESIVKFQERVHPTAKKKPAGGKSGATKPAAPKRPGANETTKRPLSKAEQAAENSSHSRYSTEAKYVGNTVPLTPEMLQALGRKKRK